METRRQILKNTFLASIVSLLPIKAMANIGESNIGESIVKKDVGIFRLQDWEKAHQICLKNGEYIERLISVASRGLKSVDFDPFAPETNLEKRLAQYWWDATVLALSSALAKDGDYKREAFCSNECESTVRVCGSEIEIELSYKLAGGKIPLGDNYENT